MIIYCRELIVKFIVNSNMNSQRITQYDCPNSDYLQVEISDKEIVVDFMKQAPGANRKYDVVQKTIGWLRGMVAEYSAEKVIHHPIYIPASSGVDVD